MLRKVRRISGGEMPLDTKNNCLKTHCRSLYGSSRKRLNIRSSSLTVDVEVVRRFGEELVCFKAIRDQLVSIAGCIDFEDGLRQIIQPLVAGRGQRATWKRVREDGTEEGVGNVCAQYMGQSSMWATRISQIGQKRIICNHHLIKKAYIHFILLLNVLGMS